MGKILALDIGDVWTGSALSDPLKIIASPYQTYHTENLYDTIHTIRDQEDIERIVVGHPTTLRGTESEQTQRVQDQVTRLTQQFPEIPFVLWDERLSSQRAEASIPGKQARTKAEKRFSHSRAAAHILDTYLKAHYNL